MTIQLFLNEHNSPDKLDVIFSSKIMSKIDAIDRYNKKEDEAIQQWYNYIESLKSYISNPVIAWDYTNKYQHFRNGAIRLIELGYDVSFIVKTNPQTNHNYVYVFNVGLKEQEYGLKIPLSLQETQTNGNSPVLSESRLRCIVKRAINEVVGETPNYKIVPNSGKIKVGEYQCVDGGGFYKINGFLGQTFVGVRMYYSPSKTYCLMRNINNWKYVFTTIETTSEKDEYGGKICRFTPIRFRDLPIEIQHNFKDLTPLLRKLQRAYS